MPAYEDAYCVCHHTATMSQSGQCVTLIRTTKRGQTAQMARRTIKPDLADNSCISLGLNLSFRLGRRALAECTGATTRELFARGVGLFASFDGASKRHVVDGTITLAQRFEGGAADKWNLKVQVYPLSEDEKKHTHAGRKPYFGVLKKIGKMGLEAAAGVTARFFYLGQFPIQPELPMSGEYFGGTFTHVIAYTLARLSETNDVFYEVTIRSQQAETFTISVDFNYRVTLDEHLLMRLYEIGESLVKNIIAPASDPEAEVNSKAEPEPKKAEEDNV